MQQTSFAAQAAELLDLNPADAFSVQEQEDLYAAAYQCYEIGNYSVAAQYFTKLVLCNPLEEKFWRGLASSKQMAQEYLAAVHAWGSSAFLTGDDPLPHFHAAECFFSLNDKKQAFLALHAAEKLLQPEDNALKAKIEILKQVHVHG